MLKTTDESRKRFGWIEAKHDDVDVRIPGPGVWTSDGMYLVFRIEQRGESDIWALPMHTGIFHRSREPIRLANGPLYYHSARPSRDGKQIFAVGLKRPGELVRYDMKSHQFVPFLLGISAISPTFSKDGQWVAYTSYPDHTLWRSRSDGTERRQLTYAPMEVGFPNISPNGTKVVFSTPRGEIYVISIDGGRPQQVIERNSWGAAWSPDGNLLVVSAWTDAPDGGTDYLQTFDLRTGKISVVPSSQGLVGGQWITQDNLVAANEEFTKLVTFDFKTQKWSNLVGR